MKLEMQLKFEEVQAAMAVTFAILVILMSPYKVLFSSIMIPATVYLH